MCTIHWPVQLWKLVNGALALKWNCCLFEPWLSLCIPITYLFEGWLVACLGLPCLIYQPLVVERGFSSTTGILGSIVWHIFIIVPRLCFVVVFTQTVE